MSFPRSFFFLLAWLGAAGFAVGDDWIGNPDALLSADNPYVRLAETNVARAVASAEGADAFWLTWGATARESSRRGDETLRTRALAATDALAAKLKARPVRHWDITVLLECLRLWTRDGGVAGSRRDGWLAAAHPSVELCFENHAAAPDGNAAWTTAAPNTQFQGAVVLLLASRLYGEERYEKLGRAVARKALGQQLPGGAFSYIRNSGPSPLYFGFDATFLGRYYQLTRDPEARAALARMAGFAREALGNGLLEGSATPWWKHRWTPGGPMHGVEVVAGVARDPLTRALAEKRLALAQPHSFSHVAMYFWDPTIPPASLGEDRCDWSGNVGGPVLRRGRWQVVMPFAPYGDTGIGVSVASERGFAFDQYVESVALPILRKEPAKPWTAGETLFMISPEETSARRALAGEGWIASAFSFQPRRGSYGAATAPAAEGWRLLQVWFADGQGAAGWLIATRLTGARAEDKPRGLVVLGRPAVPEADPRTLISDQLTFAVRGDQVERVEAQERQIWVHLPSPADGGSVAYGLSITRSGAPLVLEPAPGEAAGARVFQVRRDGETLALLYFNLGTKPVTITPPFDGRLTRAGAEETAISSPVRAGGRIALPAGELVLVHGRVSL